MRYMNKALNTRGGFIQFILMVVIVIALMNYLGISLGQVFDFILQILNFFLTLIQTILNAVLSIASNLQLR